MWNPPIFVFGSNLGGRHGKGAAAFAHRHCGAVYGQAEGRQGRAYAIPTKGRNLRRLSQCEVAGGIRRFLEYARAHPDLTFFVTQVGCGLAGFRPSRIFSIFLRVGVPANCILSIDWIFLNDCPQLWNHRWHADDYHRAPFYIRSHILP